MNSKIQLKWFGLFVLTAVSNFYIYDQFFSPGLTAHWSSKAEGRKPAQMDLSSLPSVDHFQEIFQFDNQSGHLTYDMDVAFWSDKGADYFKKNGKQAIEEGLKKTFDSLATGNKELKLPAEAKANIIKEALNTFVYTTKALKLIDSNFEIDLTFTPRNVEANYNRELDNNQLVNFSNTGNLLKDINQNGKSLPEKVLETNFAFNGDTYQYVGGAITISAEVLDTSWKITQPIPKPKKNALKGYLRLRKYYRVNDPSLMNVDKLFNSKEIEINMTHFKEEDNSKTPFITVDSLYTFNLEELIPNPEKVVIHFGELVSLDKSYDNLFKRVLRIFKKSNDIKTSDLYFKGIAKSFNGKEKFSTKIDTLVYDYETKKFTTKSRFFTNTSNTSNDNIVDSQVKREFLKNDSAKIIEALKLEEVIKK